MVYAHFMLFGHKMNQAYSIAPWCQHGAKYQ